MPKRILAGVLSAALIASNTALAGNPAPAPAQAQVIAADTSETAVGHSVVPILALIFFAAALSNGGGTAVVGNASDMRLKRDIRATGKTAAGFPVYGYRYVGGTQRYEGVMAQDVIHSRPDAVIRGPFGYLAVDYDKLGISMVAVD